MIVGTEVRIKLCNMYGSAFAGKVGIIEELRHDKQLGTYFVIGFDKVVLTYPFYANEFEEVKGVE